MRKKWVSFALCLCLAGSMLVPAAGVNTNSARAAQAAAKEAVPEGQATAETKLAEKVIDISVYDTNEVLVVYAEDEENGWKLSKVKEQVKEELPEGVEEESLTEDCSLVTANTKEELSDTLEALAENKKVAYIQPNYEYTLASVKNIKEGTPISDDTYSKYQWAYNGSYNIQMEQAWELGAGANQNVIVAVMDTGVNYEHEDLKDAMWVNSGEIAGNGKDDDGNGYADDIYGWNCADNNSEVCKRAKDGLYYTDDHGTHVAGIIAATADNAAGIAGVASKNKVQIMSVKIFPDDGEPRTSDIIRGLEYADANGATVCNMSFVTNYHDRVVEEAMGESEMLFICAAGNGDKWSNYKGYNIDVKKTYPADFNIKNIIAVANMNDQGVIDDSSCYGEELVDIAAPGTEILSSIVDKEFATLETYDSYTGTSMAAPMVTGAAALVASFCGSLNAEQIKDAVLNGSAQNAQFAHKVNSNRMLDVYGALSYYKDTVKATTKVAKVSKSNHKKVTVSVVSPSSEITDVCYAFGSLAASDFLPGEQEALTLKNSNTASFTADKTGVYSIYIKNAAGQELVKKVNVTVKTLSSLKLSSNAKILKKGKTYTLKATVAPSGIYSKVTYKSSKKSVATVSTSGKITAKKAGKATITVTSTDGETTITKKCRITVKNK